MIEINCTSCKYKVAMKLTGKTTLIYGNSGTGKTYLGKYLQTCAQINALNIHPVGYEFAYVDSAEKFFECKFECKTKNKRYIMYIDGMECWEFEDRCNAVTEIKCDDNVYIIVQKGVNYFFGSSVRRYKLRFKDNTFNLVE